MTPQASPARLSTANASFEAQFKARLHWSAQADAEIEQRVADILADVQQRGDAAVLEYTARFDGVQAASMAARCSPTAAGTHHELLMQRQSVTIHATCTLPSTRWLSICRMQR